MIYDFCCFDLPQNSARGETIVADKNKNKYKTIVTTEKQTIFQRGAQNLSQNEPNRFWSALHEVKRDYNSDTLFPIHANVPK